MKVCHFLPWYSPARIGGTEIYMLQLSKELIKKNNQALIICPASKGVTEKFEVDNIAVVASEFIIEEPASQKIKMGIDPPPHLNGFNSLLAEIQPDILHFHCFWPSQIFYLEAANKLGIKTIITPHLAGFTCLRDDLMRENKYPCDGKVLIDRCSSCLLHNRSKEQVVIQKSVYAVSKFLFKREINTGYSTKISRLFSIPFFVKNKLDIFKRINKAADALIAISPWYKKDILLNGFNPEKVKLIATAATLPASPVNLPAPEHNSFKIIFIGRQNREKGLHTLLQSTALLSPGKIELHLFGKIYPGLFEKDISDLSAKGYKIFQHGETEHSIMLEELRTMDVLCLPTPGKEMAPLVIQEAFTFGIPVIGSDLGGITDAVIEGSNGFLFRHDDPADLAMKFTVLLNNTELLKQMKLSTVQSLVHNDISGMHIQLYNELLEVQKPKNETISDPLKTFR